MNPYLAMQLMNLGVSKMQINLWCAKGILNEEAMIEEVKWFLKHRSPNAHSFNK
jgi:hypothetical protein